MKTFPFLLAAALAASQLAHAQSELLISSSGSLQITGGGTLTLSNAKLTNNGTLQASEGTVRITGSGPADQSLISGSGTTTIQQLVIDKPASNARLSQNISVTQQLTLTSGGLELAGGNVDFGSTGQLSGETESRRVSGTGGKLIASVALNAPNAANPAGLGAILTSTANLGQTVVERIHTAYAPNGPGLLRSYNISPSNNSGLNATLRYTYLDSELNGVPETNLTLWRSTDNGNSWSEQGRSASSTTENYVEKNAINAFSVWTAANGTAGALPVTLVAFSGKHTPAGNELYWQTAAEYNNAGFEIQYSADALRFENIGFVKASGKTTGQRYGFTDARLLEGMSYYRLRQVDTDGKATLSHMVALAGPLADALSVYPNPGSGKVSVRASNRHQAFRLTDGFGRVLLSGGQLPESLDLSAQPAGLYLLKTATGSVKIVRE